MSDETFEITVDGETTEARPGETVLDVCRRLGKDVPTLCHHAAIEPYAACRVCLVEIAGGPGRPADLDVHRPRPLNSFQGMT